MKTEITTLVYRTEPEDFSPIVEVAACYIEYDGKYLFLQRSFHKSEGGSWGVPGGKVEYSETPDQAVVREIFEETQIDLSQDKPSFVEKLFMRKPDVDYVYHMYYLKVSEPLAVTLNDEHQDYCWLSFSDLEKYPVMSAAIEASQHLITLSEKLKLPRKPFYFIRHGETDVNADRSVKRVDYDLPLNERGVNQARDASKIVQELPLKSVCYSPIQRAVQTKEILIPDVDFDQTEVCQLGECKADTWTKMVSLQNAEGYGVCKEVEDFFGRVLHGMEIALEKSSPTLIVAHGGIHWALCYLLSIQDHPWAIGNCQLVRFSPVNDSEWQAECIL